MAQSLEVNNKTYLPSVVLAKQFNYTADYISKLARDEKVLGTRVGRQWYVEPESLDTYFKQLEVEKRIAKEDLSLQRKLERTQKPLAVSSVARAPEPAVMVGGKALAVLMCSLVVGSLLLFGRSYDLGLTDIARGAHFIGEQLYARVAVGALSLFENEEVVATSVASPLLSEPQSAITHQSVESATVDTFTTFPNIVYERERELVLREDEAASTLDLPFSDEVIIEEDEQTLTVRPIFKDTQGQRYEVSVTAIEEMH